MIHTHLFEIENDLFLFIQSYSIHYEWLYIGILFTVIIQNKVYKLTLPCDNFLWKRNLQLEDFDKEGAECALNIIVIFFSAFTGHDYFIFCKICCAINSSYKFILI